jgi:phospholipase/carboxylesterase
MFVAYSSVMDRREVLQRGIQVLAGTVLGACLDLEQTGTVQEVDPRLTARPGNPTTTAETGLAWIGDIGEGGMYFVPSNASQSRAMPLVVFLHGAGRRVESLMNDFAPVAESAGVMLLAPLSSAGTWDAIVSSFGPDIAVLNAALEWAFNRWRIDPQRIVLSGFSDGATYALAIGRANGDLFSRVAAYSPGFLIQVDPVGLPPILVTHGTEDPVLPFHNTEQVIVPELERQGYDVDFRSFAGGHGVLLSAAHEVITDLSSP